MRKVSTVEATENGSWELAHPFRFSVTVACGGCGATTDGVLRCAIGAENAFYWLMKVEQVVVIATGWVVSVEKTPRSFCPKQILAWCPDCAAKRAKEQP